MTEDQQCAAIENTLDHVLALTGKDPRWAAAILSDALATLTYAANLDEGVVMNRVDDAMAASHEAMRGIGSG